MNFKEGRNFKKDGRKKEKGRNEGNEEGKKELPEGRTEGRKEMSSAIIPPLPCLVSDRMSAGHSCDSQAVG